MRSLPALKGWCGRVAIERWRGYLALWILPTLAIAGCGSSIATGPRGPYEDDTIDLNSTWTWTNTGFSLERPGVSPPRRIAAVMAYDRSHGNLVLFGGAQCSNQQLNLIADCYHFDDTWIWNGEAWTQAHPNTSPHALGVAMFFDEATRQLVLFASDGTTWSWDGNDWTEQPDEASPFRAEGDIFNLGVKLSVRVGYDSVRQQTVLLADHVNLDAPAGRADSNEVWVWSSGHWSKAWTQSPQAADGMRLGLVFSGLLAFDRALGALVYVGETAIWTWNGAGWTPHTKPTLSVAGDIAYDTMTNDVLLVQEQCTSRACSGHQEVWSWDGAAWQEHNAGQAGPAVTGTPSVAFDEGRGRLVLFGGQK